MEPAATIPKTGVEGAAVPMRFYRTEGASTHARNRGHDRGVGERRVNDRVQIVADGRPDGLRSVETYPWRLAGFVRGRLDVNAALALPGKCWPWPSRNKLVLDPTPSRT